MGSRSLEHREAHLDSVLIASANAAIMQMEKMQEPQTIKQLNKLLKPNAFTMKDWNDHKNGFNVIKAKAKQCPAYEHAHYMGMIVAHKNKLEHKFGVKLPDTT